MDTEKDTETNKAEQLYVANLLLTKAVMSALVKRAVLSKEDIFAELSKVSTIEDNPELAGILEIAKATVANL